MNFGGDSVVIPVVMAVQNDAAMLGITVARAMTA